MMYFEFAEYMLRQERVGTTWVPTVDVCECPAEIIVTVEIPGVDRADIHLVWKDGVLTISGNKRRHPPEEEGVRYLCVERCYGHFRRDIAINADVDFTRAKGELEDGLLRIHLPISRRMPGEVVIPIENV